MMRIPVSLLMLMWAVATSTVAAERAARNTDDMLRGSVFHRELDRPISVTREKVEIRELLERLGVERRIAIVLDRRIDPGRSIDARLPATSLGEALAAIADRAGAITRIVGDTVVVGPDVNVGQLQTICVLRGLELDAFGDALGGRRFQLARTLSLTWDDLDRPADLIEQIAAKAELEVTGLELVPHDLWAHGRLVEMSPAEALSWILLQYDLTFEWTDTAKGVRIIPLSGPVAVTKDHPIRRIEPAEALRRVQQRFPELDVQVNRKTLTATGLMEQHDVIAAIARGDDPDASPRTVKFGDLAQRRFTLRVVRQSAAAVLKTLQANNVDIQIDEAALAAANIDLDQKINLEEKQATISELLEAICKPVGATFAVDGETVHIPAP